MIYFFNSAGTTVAVKSEPIYQGSINANSLVVVAPFSRTAVITVAYTLPNGLGVVGGIMENNPFKLADLGSTPVKDKEGNIYNVWQIDIDAPVTQYAGTVQVQFTVSLGYGETLKTYATQFLVQKGVPTNLPPFSEIENAEQLYLDITNYIASINENVVEATDKAISYVRYITNDEYILNTANAENITLSVVPTGAQYKGTFTLLGMTEYLTENQIQNPTLDSNADDLFFQLQTNVGANQGGFVIDLGSVKDVGIVQMYAWSIWQNLTMKAYTSNDGDTYTLADTITFPKTAGANTLDIFRFNISKECQYVKIVQEDSVYTNGAYACKGIEVFAPNVDGYYRIVQNNGNVIEIDTFNANSLIDILNGIKEEAQDYADASKDSADDSAQALAQINAKAGQVGGYPVLADIDGSPKIPAIYINQVDIHNQFEITNEAQLETIDAQVGDVAFLVETVNGEKTVAKSWILLSITDGVRDWAVYGTSYATNSGNAQYSVNSGNAQKINGVTYDKLSQAQYDALVDKQGVYFVTIDAETTGE